MLRNLNLGLAEVLNGIENIGIYITDRERKIIFWNHAAEKITGYGSAEVVGRSCKDDILCHLDRHGRELCGTEFCPLHQSIIRGEASTVNTYVFGKCRNGKRLPMSVSVSPVRDAAGAVIGGMEVFRAARHEFEQLKMAQAIQRKMMPENPHLFSKWPISFLWNPAEMIGGDLVHFVERNDGTLGGIIVDVSGHGTASALITSFLWKLFEASVRENDVPSLVLTVLIQKYLELEIESHFFSAQCFIFDPKKQMLKFSSAGHPYPIVVDAGGRGKYLPTEGDLAGLFGLPSLKDYEIDLSASRIIFYSDGLVESRDPAGEIFGEERWLALCEKTSNRSRDDAAKFMIEETFNFAQTTDPQDDMTLLILEGERYRAISTDLEANMDGTSP